jgi:hypothetical protein
MTEQQPEDALLSELLDLPEHADQPQTDDATIAQPLLTWREERALLRAANQAGTPTLAPELGDQELNGAPRSFVSDMAGVARKYPVLALLAAGGIAFLIVRRRR